MEDNAEQAALVHSLVREVQAIVPIADDILQEQFVRLYIENDPQVHLEVSSVLASRGDDFKPQDLQVLKVLMDSHCAPQQVTIIDAMTKLKDSQASIVEQEFQLLMNQLIHDRDAWRVHRHTLGNYAASVSRLKPDWNIARAVWQGGGCIPQAALPRPGVQQRDHKACDGFPELEEVIGRAPSDPRGTRVHFCFVEPVCPEHFDNQ